MLYRRGRIWWTSFVGADGKRVRRSLHTSCRDEAERSEAEAIGNALSEATRRAVKDYHWKEAAVRWVNEATKATIDCDISTLRWLDKHLGHRRLAEITPDVLGEIRVAKLADGAANATVNRTLALVRAILRKARDEWEWGNPVPKVRLLPEPKRRIRWLTKQEAQALLKELPEHLRGPAIFTLATGLRAGNVRNLRWHNVQMDRRVALFSGDEMKSGAPLGIPLNAEAMAVVRQQIGKHREFVFTYCGEPIGNFNSSAWRKALRRAGISDFRWHDLRHTWASWHIQAGTPVEVLRELGGWSSLTMVMRYAHLAPQHLAAYADRLDAVQHEAPVLSVVR